MPLKIVYKFLDDNNQIKTEERTYYPRYNGFYDPDELVFDFSDRKDLKLYFYGECPICKTRHTKKDSSLYCVLNSESLHISYNDLPISCYLDGTYFWGYEKYNREFDKKNYVSTEIVKKIYHNSKNFSYIYQFNKKPIYSNCEDRSVFEISYSFHGQTIDHIFYKSKIIENTVWIDDKICPIVEHVEGNVYKVLLENEKRIVLILDK